MEISSGVESLVSSAILNLQKNLCEMQPGVGAFPVHSISLIYIYMEREHLNFLGEGVGICEQCIL